MAITVTQVIDAACLRYRDLTRSQALIDMQQVHDELIEFLKLTRDTQDFPLVASQQTYSFSSDILDIIRAEIRYNDTSATKLKQISSERIDREDYSPCYGVPTEIFRTASLTAGRLIGLEPIPKFSSLVVSSATATTPIVVGFTAAHGLTTGNSLYLTGLAGITGANGLWSSVTVIDSTHISLDTSVGGGAWTSGGIGATTTVPFLRLHVRRSQTLGESTNTTSLPEFVKDQRTYVCGIWFRHSDRRHAEDSANHLKNFRDERAKLSRRVTGTLADVVPVAQPATIQRQPRH